MYVGLIEFIESGPMFGKTRDPIDHDGATEGDLTVDDFFGDEAAVAETVRVDHLQQRVAQVELQINSQFTSLAAYAQIAQEQVEMVRSEALHSNERGQQRVIALVERERADRLADVTGVADVTARLDSLDGQIDEIRQGLQLCLSNQKALADAITDLFQPVTDRPITAAMDPDPVPVAPEPANAPTLADSVGNNAVFAFEDAQPLDIPEEAPTLGAFPPPVAASGNVETLACTESGPIDGPIPGLSLD
jgi:hypothetical protein